MKKKSVAAMLMAMTIMLSACGERTDLVGEAVIVRDNENRTGCVEGCICYETVTADSEPSSEETSPTSEQETTTQTETSAMQETAQSEQENEQPEQSDTQESTTEEEENISELSEGELLARREQQKNFAEARELLYTLKNSKDKTSRINQMDRQILANNAYDFSNKNIGFIGASRAPWTPMETGLAMSHMRTRIFTSRRCSIMVWAGVCSPSMGTKISLLR